MEDKPNLNEDGRAICDHAGAMDFCAALKAMEDGFVLRRVAWEKEGRNKCIRQGSCDNISADDERWNTPIILVTQDVSPENDNRYSSTFSANCEDIFALDWIADPKDAS